MENREQQILSEIKVMMETIRTQLELLDAKMLELQQCVDPEEFENNPIDLDIEESEEEPIAEATPSVDDDLPFDDISEPEAEPEPEPESEPEPEAESEPEPEPVEAPKVAAVVVEEEDDDDLPGIFDAPVSYAAARVVPKPKPTVAEVMAENFPWRTDMPGSPVKDVRSAISLNDRIIFINYLFDEDPMSFQNTITQINAMTALDDVFEYLKVEHPSWDFNSELVYRFMMAVRRRVK